VDSPRIRQLAAVAVALSLWSLGAQPELWTLVLAYALAVLGLSASSAMRRLGQLPRGLGLSLLLLLLAPGALGAYRMHADFASSEALSGAWPVLVDRLRLEREPAIAPPLLSRDRAQTFFVRAKGATGMRARLGEGTREVAAEALGHGVFRVEYDPRVHGAPKQREGALDIEIDVDGTITHRQLTVVTPRAHPRWLARSPDGSRAATVSRETDELILLSSRGLVQRVEVGDEPVDCVFIDEKRLLVAHASAEKLSLVDAHSFSVSEGPAVGRWQRRLARSPTGDMLAVLRDGPAPELLLLTSPELPIAARLPLDAVPQWVAFGHDGSTVAVAHARDARLTRYRLGSDGQLRPAGELKLGRAAVTLRRSPSGDRWLLSATDFRPDGSRHLGNHFVQDQVLEVDSDSLKVIRRLLTARRTPRQSKPGDTDRGLSPMGLHQAADGSLLVAFAGSEELARFGKDASGPLSIDTAEAGIYAPHDLVELRDGTLIISSPSAGALGMLDPGSDALRPLRLEPGDGYLLRHDSAALARRAGERGFYESTRSGISCQSCHMHGDSDHGAHNLGDHRLLPTLGVRGLLGTAPFLRDGSYARLSELDHVAQTLYRGYLRHAPGRRNTLALYMAALPRARSFRSGEARDLAAERRGLNAFMRAQCDRCHTPPAFSHLGQHRVGNLFPELLPGYAVDDSLDTPSLLSVSATAPYLNDGRAASLAEVLDEHNPNNLHGDVAALDEKQRRDLLVFLESL